MLSKHIETLGNYLWQRSLKQLSAILTTEENKRFNISDYYYLTLIGTMGSPSFSEVASALNVTKPAVSALSKRLGQIGLVEKVPSSEDGRVYYLQLTDKGRQIIESDTRLFEDLEATIQKLMPAEEQEALERLLEQVVESFRTADASIK